MGVEGFITKAGEQQHNSDNLVTGGVGREKKKRKKEGKRSAKRRSVGFSLSLSLSYTLACRRARDRFSKGEEKEAIVVGDDLKGLKRGQVSILATW